VEREGDAEQALASLETRLFATLPDQIARIRTGLAVSELAMEDLPPRLLAHMLAPDGRARVQIFPSQDLSKGGSREAFVDAVAAVSPGVSGVVVNIVEFGRATVSSFQQALVSAVLVITLLLFLLWRSVVDTALVMTPLLLAALLTTASMTLLGLPFNFTNVIVLPLLFGIGIDSGIHLVHQSKLRDSTHSNLLETTTARAVFYSALTSTVSFGSFGFCSHLGLRSLGVELTAGMILTVLCVLLLLPALIQLRSGGTRIPHRDP
jgi:predicted RND superfamily exporter protein